MRNIEELVYALVTMIMAILQSALAAAMLGRFVWHLRLVQQGERKLVGIEAVLELFTVPLVYMVALGLAGELGLTGAAVPALTALVAYIGPNGFQALLEAYVRGRR